MCICCTDYNLYFMYILARVCVCRMPFLTSVEPMPSQCIHLSGLRIPKSTRQMCPTLPDIFSLRFLDLELPDLDAEPDVLQRMVRRLDKRKYPLAIRTVNHEDLEMVYYTCDSPLWMAHVLYCFVCGKVHDDSVGLWDDLMIQGIMTFWGAWGS